MTRYSDHILAATPCFFVSPTSLAQFVPPGSATFDVVVFDEPRRSLSLKRSAHWAAVTRP